MGGFFEGQEFRDVVWATPIPVAVQIGDQQERVRARGRVSVGVIDTALAAGKITDPNALEPQVRLIMADAASEALAEGSRDLSNVEELLGMDQKLRDVMRQKAEPLFRDLGLKITGLEIESIEGLTSL